MRHVPAYAEASARSFTITSALPEEVGPMVLVPVYATLNLLVVGFLITRDTIPIIWRWCERAHFRRSRVDGCPSCCPSEYRFLPSAQALHHQLRAVDVERADGQPVR
jgi:hypothetical protein